METLALIGWFNLAKVEFLRLEQDLRSSWENEAKQHFAIRMEFTNKTSFEDEATYRYNDRATPLFATSW